MFKYRARILGVKIVSQTVDFWLSFKCQFNGKQEVGLKNGDWREEYK